jgi:LmbE family N-acetylglucosaminyl deacetylase
VKAGGKSFASIMLSREETRSQVREAAAVLGVDMYFPEFISGEVQVDGPSKKKLIRIIRETRPDIIITQDPEHSYHDLDPDRRLAMLLILESIALAGRDYALAEMEGLSPHPVPTIYYMTPENPNCIVDIADVWDLKEQAMDTLTNQMAFSGQHYQQYYSEDHLKFIVPNWSELMDDYMRGREMHRQLDRVVHMAHGASAHSHFAVAESFRRQGLFHLDNLIR